jgi:hypothetical protein
MTRDRLPFILTVSVLLLTALWLLWQGRVPICECGYVKLWHGQTMSSENSQHLSDWYTPSHVIHGLIFYAALAWLVPRLSFGWRLLIATTLEALWEAIENSATIIERYRAVTISLDYYGDSVINTVAAILAMGLGFWMAARLPVWISVVLAVGFEALVIWLIRDGLALNILMLIYPLEAVKLWQAG